MIKRIGKKLNTNAGESLAEVLVALLIAALALVMLASMITSSASIIQNSRKNIEAYYAANNALESKSGGAYTTGSVSTSVPLAYGSGITVNVSYYKNADVPGGKQVVSFK